MALQNVTSTLQNWSRVSPQTNIFGCSKNARYSRSPTSPSISEAQGEVAALQGKIKELEESLQLYKSMLDMRKDSVVRSQFLADDVRAELRREQSLHAKTKARCESASEALSRHQFREKDLEDKLHDLKTRLERCHDEKSEALQDLERRQLQIRVYNCALVTAFRLSAELRDQTSFQQLVSLSARQLPARANDELTAGPTQSVGVAKRTANHVSSSDDDVPITPSRKRKLKDHETDDPFANNDKKGYEGGARTPPPSETPMTPPSSTKRKLPRRAARSDINTGFYRIMHTGSHLRWE